MSLRTRLVIALAATLAVSLVLAGVALVGLTRQSLAERVDQELITIASTSDRIRRLQDIAGDNEAGRRVAVMRLDRRGNIQRAFPSGFASDPDPLPDLPLYPDGIPDEAFDTIETRTSDDGSVTYRVIMGRGPAGAAIAVAHPLTGVEEATRALVRTLLVVGGFALVVLTALAYVILRRGLRPLERLEGAARTITAGDLSHRTGIPHDQTEVGRVGAAFDTMVDQLQAGFASQQAALDAKAASEERLRRFVADASHELRTPLTAVRGYADLYRAGGLADPGQLDAAMDRIGTEGRRMGLLVDDLLLLARLDQGRPLRADPVDLSRVARDAVTDARALEPDRPVSAAIDDAITVTGDEDRVRQVVGNLLTNVRVHTPADAPVELVLRRMDAEGVAELRVVDHGPGIETEHAPYVFDRFYRADPGRSRERGGSGLGLSIVASITHALGGRLWHEPTPGGGATFVLRLPLPVATPLPAEAPLPAPAPFTGNAQQGPGQVSGPPSIV